eukprot:s6810_g2.t1
MLRAVQSQWQEASPTCLRQAQLANSAVAMDALDVLEVQLLERQIKLAEERHAAGESRESVGLDQLKQKLSAVKSRAKSAHDAIGAALLKVREKETSAESLPPDSAIAVEAGISGRDIASFKFEHRRGKQLSPFTMVDLGDYALKQQLLESISRKYDKKGIKEWTNAKLNQLQNGNNKDSINGMIKILPYSWKHLTIQNAETGEHIAWLAYDHVEGVAKPYINSTLYSARAFEDEFITACGNIMSRKVIGNKRKGKGNSTAEGVLTTGDFLKAVGLTPEGKGSYVKPSTLTLKTKVPFTFDVKAITNDEKR